MPHRRHEPRATAEPRRFACDLAVFINRADVGVWVRSTPAVGGGRSFLFSPSSDRRRKPVCRVTQTGLVTACTCTGPALCDHIRALWAVGLLTPGSEPR